MKWKYAFAILAVFSLFASLSRLHSAQAQTTPCSIVFTSDRNNNPGSEESDIYKMDCDGGNVERLTTNMAPAYTPEVSPDGTKLLFDANLDLRILDLETGTITNLTNTGSGIREHAPVWSPNGTKIAFVEKKDGLWGISVMNADGSNRIRLTTHTNMDSSPHWSPDGTKIAFQANRKGDDDIYVMNADGTAMTQLTNNSSADVGPAWSPDGTKIAFSSLRDGGVFDLFMMNADGSGQVNITNTANAHEVRPRWTADGAWIVVGEYLMQGTYSWNITKIHPDGSGRTALENQTSADQYPSFIPQVLTTTPTPTLTPTPSPEPLQTTSCSIVFSSDRDNSVVENADIYQMDCEGGNVERLTTMAPSFGPEVSPDGTKVLFYAHVKDAEIYTLDLATREITNLTNTPDREFLPAWSPDGTKIAYAEIKDGLFGISVMNADGSNRTRLTTNVKMDWAPNWAPDGSKIVFQANRDGDDEIFTINDDGSGLTQLTHNSFGDHGPAWSPDGNKIAYMSQGAGNVFDIFVMSPDGTNRTNITNSSPYREFSPRWSPDGQWIVFAEDVEGNPNWEVTKIRIDGSERLKLTSYSGWDAYPSFAPTVSAVTPTPTPTPEIGGEELLIVTLEPIVLAPQDCPGGSGPGGILAANYPPEKLTQEERQWLFNAFGNEGIAPVGYGGERCGNSYDDQNQNFNAMVCTSGQTGPGGIIPGGYNPEELSQEQRQWLFEIFGNSGTAPVGFGGPRCPDQENNYTVNDVHVAEICSSGALGPYRMHPQAYNPTELNQDERQWLWNMFEGPDEAPVGYGGPSCPGQTQNAPPPDRTQPYDPYRGSSSDLCSSLPTNLNVGDLAVISSPNLIAREHPRHDAAQSMTVPYGEIVTIVSGPSCDDGNVWWQIGRSNSQGGFVSEIGPNTPGIQLLKNGSSLPSLNNNSNLSETETQQIYETYINDLINSSESKSSEETLEEILWLYYALQEYDYSYAYTPPSPLSQFILDAARDSFVPPSPACLNFDPQLTGVENCDDIGFTEIINDPSHPRYNELKSESTNWALWWLVNVLSAGIGDDIARGVINTKTISKLKTVTGAVDDKLTTFYILYFEDKVSNTKGAKLIKEFADYAGRTVNISTRTATHKRNYSTITGIPEEDVIVKHIPVYVEKEIAPAMEQALIETAGGKTSLLNKINAVAQNSPEYENVNILKQAWDEIFIPEWITTDF